MTFAARVKAELCEIEARKACCIQAEAYGMALFARAFRPDEVCLQTENEMVARRYQNLLKKVCGVTVRFTFPRTPGGMIVAAANAKDCTAILERFSHTGQELALRINRANLEDECCMAAFLRGAFLSAGTLTNPEKDYHLEFLVSHRRLAQDLAALLAEVGLPAKSTQRRGCMVVYYKESEHIEDLLTMMQATLSSLELMNVKIYKDLRNRVNRVTNCETANLSKTVEAVHRQLWAIDLIDRTSGLQNLPEGLQEIALMRREHEEMSLSELGQELKRPLSRSGVNHRLQKLIRIAQEIEKSRES